MFFSVLYDGLFVPSRVGRALCDVIKGCNECCWVIYFLSSQCCNETTFLEYWIGIIGAKLVIIITLSSNHSITFLNICKLNNVLLSAKYVASGTTTLHGNVADWWSSRQRHHSYAATHQNKKGKRQSSNWFWLIWFLAGNTNIVSSLSGLNQRILLEGWTFCARNKK